MGFVTVMVPLLLVHVGCETDVCGADGVFGAALIVTGVAPDSQPSPFLTLTWYVPGANAPDVAEVPYVAPLSKLYVTPVVGLVTVMVPLALAHVGCDTDVCGAEGVFGAALIVTGVADDSHFHRRIFLQYLRNFFQHAKRLQFYLVRIDIE